MYRHLVTREIVVDEEPEPLVENEDGMTRESRRRAGIGLRDPLEARAWHQGTRTLLAVLIHLRKARTVAGHPDAATVRALAKSRVTTNRVPAPRSGAGPADHATQ